MLKVLLPFTQIGLWIVIYEISIWYYRRFAVVQTNGVDWGISAKIYFFYFIGLFATTLILTPFGSRKRNVCYIVFFGIFCGIIHKSFDSYPYKTALVGALTALSFAMEPLALLVKKGNPSDQGLK